MAILVELLNLLDIRTQTKYSAKVQRLAKLKIMLLFLIGNILNVCRYKNNGGLFSLLGSVYCKRLFKFDSKYLH